MKSVQVSHPCVVLVGGQGAINITEYEVYHYATIKLPSACCRIGVERFSLCRRTCRFVFRVFFHLRGSLSSASSRSRAGSLFV